MCTSTIPTQVSRLTVVSYQRKLVRKLVENNINSGLPLNIVQYLNGTKRPWRSKTISEQSYFPNWLKRCDFHPAARS